MNFIVTLPTPEKMLKLCRRIKFRNPVPAHKHTAAQFLSDTGILRAIRQRRAVVEA